MSTDTDTRPAEPDPAAVEAAETAMRERGEPTHERVQEDYFAFDQTRRVELPDGVSYVEIKTFSEGERRKYLNSINRDVVLQRSTGDAKMQMRPGDERWALLRTAIVGWNLTRNGQPVNFDNPNLEQFLSKAPPRVIDVIDKEVRKDNAWLLEDMTLEDLIKERDNLNELIEAKEREEQGN
jgi:hypothetical protein